MTRLVGIRRVNKGNGFEAQIMAYVIHRFLRILGSEIKIQDINTMERRDA